jgi:hypothetical protein
LLLQRLLPLLELLLLLLLLRNRWACKQLWVE